MRGPARRGGGGKERAERETGAVLVESECAEEGEGVECGLDVMVGFGKGGGSGGEGGSAL